MHTCMPSVAIYRLCKHKTHKNTMGEGLELPPPPGSTQTSIAASCTPSKGSCDVVALDAEAAEDGVETTSECDKDTKME